MGLSRPSLTLMREDAPQRTHALRELFNGFDDISIVKRQLMPVELPDWLKWMPLRTAEKLMGWNLIIKARKPRS